MPRKKTHLNRDSMSDRVKRDILGRILAGEFPPGSRLVEMQLARDFNTSQGPVREALCQLEGMDLVITEPYRGTRVREVSIADIRESYLVRASLEELAGQLAAPHFKGNTQALRKAAQAALSAARQDSVYEFTRHNIEFHRMIVEASHNRSLTRAWNLFAFEVHVQFRLLRQKVDLVEAQEPHWLILEALDKGDAVKSGKLLRRHILDAMPKEAETSA